jgi:hypothetical protein
VYRKAKETLSIKNMKRKLIREFGDLGEYLIDERHLFITLMVLIDTYKNSSHTMISYQVGLNILRNIYRKTIKSVPRSFPWVAKQADLLVALSLFLSLFYSRYK